MNVNSRSSVVGIASAGALFLAIGLTVAMILGAIPVRNYTVAAVVLVAIAAAITAIMDLRRPMYDSQRGRRAAIVVLTCCVGGYLIFGCVWTFFALKYGW